MVSGVNTVRFHLQMIKIKKDVSTRRMSVNSGKVLAVSYGDLDKFSYNIFDLLDDYIPVPVGSVSPYTTEAGCS